MSSKIKDNKIKKGTKKKTKKNNNKKKIITVKVPDELLPDMPRNLQLRIKSFFKIGEFNITKFIGIGDYDLQLLKLKAGKYAAYRADDNLIIIHESAGQVTQSTVESWNWQRSIIRVWVDSGTFSFCDYEIVKKINLYNKVPFLEEAPLFDNHDYEKDCFMINTKMIEFMNIPDELVNTIYGVCAQTGIGDGAFSVYTYNRMAVMLVGGLTQRATLKTGGKKNNHNNII